MENAPHTRLGESLLPDNPKKTLAAAHLRFPPQIQSPAIDSQKQTQIDQSDVSCSLFSKVHPTRPPFSLISGQIRRSKGWFYRSRKRRRWKKSKRHLMESQTSYLRGRAARSLLSPQRCQMSRNPKIAKGLYFIFLLKWSLLRCLHRWRRFVPNKSRYILSSQEPMNTLLRMSWFQSFLDTRGKSRTYFEKIRTPILLLMLNHVGKNMELISNFLVLCEQIAAVWSYSLILMRLNFCLYIQHVWLLFLPHNLQTESPLLSLLSTVSFLRKHKMSEQNITFKEAVCNDTSKKLLSSEKPGDNEQQHNKNNAKKSMNNEDSKTKGESSEKSGLEEYLSNLAKVKNDFQKQKETSLMGCILGDPIEISKLRPKLLHEWKNIKGEVRIFAKPNFWFEIVFTNPLDRKMIWEARPFHVFGLLVILKPWKPNFNTLTESNTIADLWVRIPQIPPEYVNREAIRVIIESNGVGKFVKLDSFSERGKGVNFTRICINLDVDGKRMDYVPIPDVDDVVKNFPIWYEDFSVGCGFCANEGHTYDVFPLRGIRTKPFRNYRPPSTKKENDMEGKVEGEWKYVGRKGSKAENTYEVRPYLSSKYGTAIPKEDNSSLSSKESTQHPNEEKEVSTVVEKCEEIPKEKANEQIVNENKDIIEQTKSKDEQAEDISPDDDKIGVDHESMPPLTVPMQVDDETKAKTDEIEKKLLEDDEQDETSVDERSVAEFTALLFKDGNIPEELKNMLSENSFHSTETNNTVNKMMDAMEVNQESANSDSSLGKRQGGGEDSASSKLKGKKKQKCN